MMQLVFSDIEAGSDLHDQGKHGVEFFTRIKVVVERWPKEGSRMF